MATATQTLFTLGDIKAAKSHQAAADMIKSNLAVSDHTVIRMLKLLTARQTADEQRSEETKFDNGVGYTASDARILTSFTKQVEAWERSSNRRFPEPLSPRQFAKARQKLVKYAMQVAKATRSMEG